MLGVAVAHLMFELPAFSLAQHARSGAAQWLSEFVATFGLVTVIRGCSRLRTGTAVAFAVGAYITAAYWFTASTSFANPAVTVARSPTDTFTGIRPGDVHSAGRSQIAAAFLNQLADPTRVRGVSAGTEPAARVHPEVVDVMREIGLDLSSCRPRKLTDELAGTRKLLVTMGCGEQCPFVPGLRRLDWSLRDPNGQPVESVRAIRDELRQKVNDLVRDNGWMRNP